MYLFYFIYSLCIYAPGILIKSNQTHLPVPSLRSHIAKYSGCGIGALLPLVTTFVSVFGSHLCL